MNVESERNKFFIDSEEFIPKVNNDEVYVILEKGIPVMVTKTLDMARKHLSYGRTLFGPVEFKDTATITFSPRRDPIYPEFYPPELPSYRKSPEFAKREPLSFTAFRPLPKPIFPTTPDFDFSDFN
jgi:hypothetical protein